MVVSVVALNTIFGQGWRQLIEEGDGRGRGYRLLLSRSAIDQLTPPVPKTVVIRAKTEAPDEGEDILEDFSDGLEALTAVPVWFLSTWLLPLI